jgi:Family of unknown function (DUF6263)
MMITCSRLVAAGLMGIGVIAGPAIPASEQEATLRYRWTKGETVRYRHTQQSTATISGLPGGMGDMVVNSTMSQVFKVAAEDVASDGVATLRFTYDAIQLEMTSPVVNMSYDSTAPEKAVDPSGGRMNEMFSAFLGESFTVVMTSAGDLQKIDGMGPIADKVFSKMPQDPAMAQMLNGVKNTFTDDSIKSTISQGFIRMPERAVKPGDTWNSDFTSNNPMLGAITMSIVSTLKALDGSGADQVARIATKSTLKADPKSPGTTPMGFTVQMNDGVGEGDVAFDPAKGRVRKADIRSTLNMSMSGSAPDGSAMNMKTFVKAVLTLELVQ